MAAGNLVSVVRHWWWALLLATLLAGFAAYVSSEALPAQHEARVRLLVGGVVADGDTLRAAEGMTRTAAELVTSEAVVDAVITELDLPDDPTELRLAIRPTSDSSTRVLIVRVVDNDPERAKLIANELATQLSRVVSTGRPRTPTTELLVVDTATATVPVGTSPKLIAILGAFAGLVATATVVLMLENLKQAVRSERDLTTATGLDYLGSVVSAGRPTDAQGFIVETASGSPRAAHYRMLATKVELLAARDGSRSLVVLGVGRTQGSGELAANIAKVMSEHRRCVTLVDANPQTREITNLLDLTDRGGLTDLLDEVERREDEEVHPGRFTFSRDPRLFVMPFGHGERGVTSHAIGAPWLLDRLLNQAEFLVVNTASPERAAGSLTWAGAVDATILVVPRNRTHRSDLTYVVESLRLVGARIVGVVFEEQRRFHQVIMRRPVAPREDVWAPGKPSTPSHDGSPEPGPEVFTLDRGDSRPDGAP